MLARFLIIRSAIAVMALGLLTGLALARPDTRSMTCSQAQALVKQRGAVTLSTGTHTFARFVASASGCLVGQRASRGSAPTKDNKNCQVGFKCREQPSGR